MKKILLFFALIFCCTVGVSATTQQYHLDPNGLTPSLAKFATPKSERSSIEIFNISMRNALSEILNSELTNNIISGNTMVISGKKEQEKQRGRLIIYEAKHRLDEIMESKESLTAGESEKVVAKIPEYGIPLVEGGIKISLVWCVGGGPIGALITAGVLFVGYEYENKTVKNIYSYVQATDDVELQKYHGNNFSVLGIPNRIAYVFYLIGNSFVLWWLLLLPLCVYKFVRKKRNR